MASTDREALSAVFRLTGGAGWRRRRNWDTDAALETWEGVKVNNQGRVVTLDLPGNNLQGTIPVELGKLTALEALILGRNNLSGPIPPALGKLAALQTLYLEGNQLSGRIPPELGALSELQVLALHNNKLTGRIPPELGALSELQVLALINNKLTGPIPPELGKLAALATLNLQNNQLTGPIPPELGKLTALVQLRLWNNQLSGRIPPELGNLGALTALDLDANKLSGPIPPALGKLAALQDLSLYRNQLSGPIPVELGRLAVLEYLSLGGNELTGPIPKELGALSRLETLWLHHNNLTGAVPACLVKLGELFSLGLGDNQLSGPVPSLQQLKDLRDALVSPGYRHREDARIGMAKLTLDGEMRGTPMKAFQRGKIDTDKIFSDEDVEGGTSTTISGTSFPGKGEAEKFSMVKPRNARPVATKTRDVRDTTVDGGMAEISGFDGYVMAWSFGQHPAVLRSNGFEFELEVPRLGRNVPALIGLRSSSAEVVDGEKCLLHPVVTCLARSGEVFDPPLCLRFPVGDVNSMESGSDCGSDDAEVTYRAYLESTFSTLTRKHASSEWVPVDGTIEQTDEGIFVLEVQVSHFCDFALKQAIKVDSGGVELVKLPQLKHKSRRSHYHFVNLGTENLVVHCWGVTRKRGFLESFRLKLGFGLNGGDAEVEATRTLVDAPGTGVYKVDVPGGPVDDPRNEACLVVNGFESLTVAYTTQKTVRAGTLFGSTHELVQVWGTRHMQHKHAMIFGILPESALVPNLKVEDGVNVGELVRSKV